MSVVTLQQIRIQRLKEFAKLRGIKGVVAIGVAIGKSPAQVANLLSGVAAFGEKVAGSIEMAAGLPDLWLDHLGRWTTEIDTYE